MKMIGYGIADEDSQELANLAGQYAAQVFANATEGERTAGFCIAGQILKMLSEASGDAGAHAAPDIAVMALGMLYQVRSGEIGEAELAALYAAGKGMAKP